MSGNQFVVSSLQELSTALADANGGDVIKVAPGNYGDWQIRNVNFSEKVLITSLDPNDRANFNQTLNIFDSSNIKFEAIDFVRTEVSDDGYNPQLGLWGVDGISFSDMVVSGVLKNGLPHEGGIVIRSGSQNVLIEDADISHTSGRAINILGESQYITIKDSVIHDVRSDGIQIGTNTGEDPIRFITIQNNKFLNFVQAGNDHPDMIQIFSIEDGIVGATDITIQGNVFSNDEEFTHTMLMSKMDRFVISDNIIANGHLHGISFHDAFNGVVSNNILVPSVDGAEKFANGIPQLRIADSTNVTVENNIVVEPIYYENNNNLQESGNILLSNDPSDPNYFKTYFTNLGVDVVKLQLGEVQTLPSFDSFPRLIGDIDGDGSSDLVGFGVSSTLVSLSNGDGTFGSIEAGLENFAKAQGWSSYEQFPRLLADIDGDGNDDIVGFGAGSTITALSNGDGRFAPARSAVNDFSSDQGWSSYDDFPRLLGDIDGDGDDDIVGFGATITLTGLSNGYGTFTSVKPGVNNFSKDQGWSSFDEYPRLLGDFDGDGNTDVVGFGANATLVALSNGDGTFDTAKSVLNDFSKAQGWRSFEEFPRAVGDVNGDGNYDLIGFGYDATLVALSNGDGTFSNARSVVDNFSTVEGWSSYDSFPRFVDDVNGDGSDDLIGFGANNTFAALSNGDGTFGEIQPIPNDFGNGQDWATFDTFAGSEGNAAIQASLVGDTFVFADDGFGERTITDFDEGIDLLDLSRTSYQFDDLEILSNNNGGDTFIDAPGGNSITLVGVSSNLIDQSDFIF